MCFPKNKFYNNKGQLAVQPQNLYLSKLFRFYAAQFNSCYNVTMLPDTINTPLANRAHHFTMFSKIALCRAAFMPRPTNMRRVRGVNSCKFTYSNENVVCSGPNM